MRTTLPRLAVNAALAGAWAACLLALLVFFLNPDVSLTLRNFWPLALPLIVFHAPASGVAWALLAGLVRLFVAFRVRTPWVGFRPFWRFLVADFCLLAALYVHNLRQARDYLPPAMIAHLQSATLLLSLAAALMAADALWRGWSRRRARPVAAVAAALLLTAGLLSIRERYREEQPPRSASEIEPEPPRTGLLLVGLDGAAADDFLPLVAEGRLPSFEALSRSGSTAPLTAPRPARGTAAWASVLTGFIPAAHGAVDDTVFTPPGGAPVFHLEPAGAALEAPARLGLLRLGRSAAVELSGETVDRILERSGYHVLVAGWDQLLPHRPQPAAAGAAATELPPLVEIHLEALMRHQATAQGDPQAGPLAGILSRALTRDLAVGRALLSGARAAATSAETGSGASRPLAMLARFAGLDEVAQVFLRYQRPEAFGNVTDDELDRYAAVLVDYFRFVDAWVGALQSLAGPDARVVAVSPYGVEPVGVARRMWNALTGRWYLSGTPSGTGFLLAAGPGFREGGRLEGARAEDVLPTLLYVLDLPVGRDMSGQPLPRFASDAFAETHAVSAVPSWQTVTVVGPSRVW